MVRQHQDQCEQSLKHALHVTALPYVSVCREHSDYLVTSYDKKPLHHPFHKHVSLGLCAALPTLPIFHHISVVKQFLKCTYLRRKINVKQSKHIKYF